MTYRITTTPLAPATLNGRKVLAWHIVQEGTEAEVQAEWDLQVPRFFTVTLFEQALTTGTGKVQPELGLTEGWGTDGLDHIDQNDLAEVVVRNLSPVKVTARDGRLYGRTSLSNTAGSDFVLETRITLVEGH